MKNASIPGLGSQTLGRSEVAHGRLVAADAGGVGAWKNSISAVGLLVDGDVMRQASQEVQLALDPTEYLLRGHKHLEVSEAN